MKAKKSYYYLCKYAKAGIFEYSTNFDEDLKEFRKHKKAIRKILKGGFNNGT